MCISSTCPFSRPVSFHWRANCFCDRLAITIVTTTERGTVSSEIAASRGLMVSIMIRTPMRVSTAVMIWVRLCCMVVAMLSMSFVIRLRMSPRAWSSKYFSGSLPSLRSTSRRSP